MEFFSIFTALKHGLNLLNKVWDAFAGIFSRAAGRSRLKAAAKADKEAADLARAGNVDTINARYGFKK